VLKQSTTGARNRAFAAVGLIDTLERYAGGS